MLKVKYFAKFKTGFPTILIIGTQEDFLSAGNYLVDKEEVMLNDPKIIKYYGGQALSEYLLRLKEKECSKLSEIFLKCAEKTEGYHAYLTISTLPDVKVLISVNEYGDEVLSSS